MEPYDTRKVRDTDEEHVKKLAKEIKSRPWAAFTMMLGNVVESTKEQLQPQLAMFANPGTITVEVIAGNHTRTAIEQINKETEDDNFQVWPVKLYAGLSTQQALILGHQHNLNHAVCRKPTFEEDVKLFRRKLTEVTTGQAATPKLIKDWKQSMVKILHLKVSTLLYALNCYSCY